MPANLSPEYKAAELHYRGAREPKERLQWLREMLRVIPKHKGTDHLQGDIKRRIKALSEEVESPNRRGGARSAPAIFVHSEGAAQLALIGPPNSGKSSLHAKLTGSNAQIAPYPFTTQYPEPGMMPYLDIAFQLVDLPAIAPEHPVPWIADALHSVDGCLMVVDLSDAACVEQVQSVHAVLRQRRVSLSECWDPAAEDRQEDDPFALRLPTLLLDSKADRVGNPEEDLEVFRELTGLRYPALAVSVLSGRGLGELGPLLFQRLRIVRAYTKTPGHPPDRNRPFALRQGQTVEDVARLVHPDLARTLRYARLWGKSGFDGQHVGREHRIEDGDVIELHG